MIFPSTTMEHGTMGVSHMTMMVLHGVMLVMVKSTTVRLSLTVQCPGKLVSLSVIIMMTNLCLVECKTRSSGDPCVFPFYYKGTYHYECITHDNDGYPWCMIDDSGTKHDCKSACPGNLVMTIQCNYNDDQPLFSIM